MVAVTTTRGAEIKGLSIRKVENRHHKHYMKGGDTQGQVESQTVRSSDCSPEWPRASEHHTEQLVCFLWIRDFCCNMNDSELPLTAHFRVGQLRGL